MSRHMLFAFLLARPVRISVYGIGVPKLCSSAKVQPCSFTQFDHVMFGKRATQYTQKGKRTFYSPLALYFTKIIVINFVDARQHCSKSQWVRARYSQVLRAEQVASATWSVFISGMTMDTQNSISFYPSKIRVWFNFYTYGFINGHKPIPAGLYVHFCSYGTQSLEPWVSRPNIMHIVIFIL